MSKHTVISKEVAGNKYVEILRLAPGRDPSLRHVLRIQIYGNARQGGGYATIERHDQERWHMLHDRVAQKTGERGNSDNIFNEERDELLRVAIAVLGYSE